MLNHTYNSKTLEGRVSGETLAVIQQAEEIAEKIESSFKSLSASTMLSETERKEAFGDLPDFAATYQVQILQENISNLEQKIDAEFIPKHETEGSMWLDYTKDKIQQAIKAATPENGQAAPINIVSTIKLAISSSGSTMPAKAALALPHDISCLRNEADREAVKQLLLSDENKKKIENFQAEIHAVKVNAEALTRKHTELAKQLQA